jgi:hypothetical protein
MPNPLAARSRKPEEKIIYFDSSPNIGNGTAVHDIPAYDF